MQDSTSAIMQAGNLYVYCKNNPVMWVDPWGLSVFGAAARAMADVARKSQAQAAAQTAAAQAAATQAAAAKQEAKVAPKTEIKASASRHNINDIWDHHTINRIGNLHPAIHDVVVAFILDTQSRGIYLRVTSGYRSFAEQDALFAQGRTAPGNRVTNARGGYSWHNFGLAIDVVEIDRATGQALWNNSNWDLIGEIGKFHGFEWGGDWTGFVDRPHFQMTFGFTTAQLRERRSQGLMINGFVRLD